MNHELMETGPDFQQRRGTRRRTFALAEDAVVVCERGIGKKRQVRIPYVLLSDQRMNLTVSSRPALWVAAAALLAGTIAGVDGLVRSEPDAVSTIAIYAVITVLFGTLWWFSRENLIAFQAGHEPLVLAEDKPTRQKVQEFLEILATRKAAHLRERYLSQVGGGSIADELQKLVWLRDRDAISEAEFNDLKRRLLKRPGWNSPQDEFLH